MVHAIFREVGSEDILSYYNDAGIEWEEHYYYMKCAHVICLGT